VATKGFPWGIAPPSNGMILAKVFLNEVIVVQPKNGQASVYRRICEPGTRIECYRLRAVWAWPLSKVTDI
jgi:hypothetical protein